MNTLSDLDELGAILKGLRSADQGARNMAARALAPILGSWFLRFFLGRRIGYAEAESLTVTSVSKTVLAAGQFELRHSPNEFRAWAMRIARNTLADWCREQLPTEPLPETVHELAAPIVAPGKEGNGGSDSLLAACIGEALGALEPRDAELIRMRFLGGNYGFSEIADELGITTVNARVATFRAVRRLGRRLRAEPRIRQWLREDRTKQPQP